MPRINLLPWREQQRTERKRSFVVGMFFALFGAAVVSGVGYVFMGALVDAQASRNQRLSGEIKVLDKKIEEINNLELQKQQQIARMQIIETLQRSRSEIVHVFDTFVKTVPDGMYLTSVVQTGQKFKVQGVTQSSTLLSVFMRALEGSEWLIVKDDALPEIQIQPGTSASSSFSVEVTQVTAASPAPPPKKKTGAKK